MRPGNKTGFERPWAGGPGRHSARCGRGEEQVGLLRKGMCRGDQHTREPTHSAVTVEPSVPAPVGPSLTVTKLAAAILAETYYKVVPQNNIHSTSLHFHHHSSLRITQQHGFNQLIGKQVIRSLDIIKTCEIQYDTNQPCVAINLLKYDDKYISNCKDLV